MSSKNLPSTERNELPASLSDVLAPYPVDQFFQDNWCKSFKHIPGWKGKFTELLTWARLNEILRQHRLEPPRLRLALDGKMIPPENFIKYLRGKRRQFSPIPSLLPTQLTEHLYQGATLVLDAVDELHEPLTQLAESLERLFQVHIQMNIYAGWKISNGFDLHWDDHEVLVLQATGRKRWKVYRPTRLYPLGKDLVENSPPTEDPVWDGILEDGDVLYIPRGWWHVALPLAEPTLHITVGITNPTGVDLLTWMIEHLRAKELVRMDLPRLWSAVEQQDYLDNLRTALLEACDGDLLSRFFHRSDAMAIARPRFSFPWSVLDEGLPPHDTARVQITAPRPLRLQVNPSEGTVEFLSHGKLWQFDQSTETILTLLKDGQTYSIAELCQASSAHLDHQSVRTFLGELIVSGLVAVVSDISGSKLNNE